MGRELPGASLLENVRFNALVIVPNAVQGLFRRRPRAVAAATKANVDGHAVGLIRGIRRGKGSGPVWVRVVKDRALLLLNRNDVRRVLEGSPHPFASDPENKKKGMAHFQPDALTITRGALWEKRRRFTEAVLDTWKPLHRLAERFRAVAREETDGLAAGELDWERWYGLFRQLTRRVLFGDSARHDEEISDLLTGLMDEANTRPSERSDELDVFMDRIRDYVDKAEEGSLVSQFAEAPSDPETKPDGQVAHWFFATQETLSTNAFRALALIASHPRQQASVKEELGGANRDSAEGIAGLQYLDACLEEAMRLWPTTPLLARETTRDTELVGERIEEGTQVMIVNVFNHRQVEDGDRFVPERWHDGARDDYRLNALSHGAQDCPGADLVSLIGTAVLREALERWELTLAEPELPAEGDMPYSLDFYAIRFEVAA